jgi:drug/metabolite transporter (DMT)-like permease
MTLARRKPLYIAIALVVLSGLVHSIWNLFTKKSMDKVVFLWYCQWVAILVFLPMTVYELASAYMTGVSLVGWGLVAASMALHGTYVLLLAKAYTLGDLSQAYPIMRGMSPLLVPLFGVFVLGEHVGWMGWAGIVLIVVGIFFVNGFRMMGAGPVCNKTTLTAMAVGIMIAGYTVVDKMTLAHVPPVTLNEAGNLGNVVALSWMAIRSGALGKEWRINWRTIVLGGVLAPGGYILFLMALQIMPVAQLAPMREIGTVFGTLFGVFLLKEQQGSSRIAASILITSGIILLAQNG